MDMRWGRALRALREGNIRITDLHHSRLAIAAYGAFRRGLSALGLQVVVKSFYSPIPDVVKLQASLWERRSDLAGIVLDLDQQLRFLKRELAPYVDEFRPPGDSEGRGFQLENPSYGSGDAELLYAMIRHTKPKRVVELGSGHTTRILAHASAANERDGAPAELWVFDPFPAAGIASLPGVTRVEETPAQDVRLDVFTQLGERDVLFVDTTHTVKIGGDVNRIVLDVLPRLRPGVVVHFHDIFLPWEYPRSWIEDLGLYWTEQYLLQAFLAHNAAYEIICAMHALWRTHRAEIDEFVPSLREGGAPGAFWIRRTV